MRYPEEEGLDYDDTLDPETLPDPYFDGMSTQQVWDELDRLEYEAWVDEKRAQMWYEYEMQERGW